VLEGWNQGRQERLEGGGLWRSSEALTLVPPSGHSDEGECFDARILGDGDFVEDILRQAEAEEQQNQTIQKMWSKEELLQRVASWKGVPAQALLSTDRNRRLVEARSMLVHAAIDWLALPGTMVGSWLKLSGAGVSKARVRGRLLAEKNRFLQWLKGEKVNSVP